MIKNYILTTLRQLWKHKLFSVFNIFGLATSMAVCLLLILILNDQLGYDLFHADKDRIYRVVSGRGENSVPTKPRFATSPLVTSDMLKEAYPIVENSTKIIGMGGLFKWADREAVFDHNGFMVEEDFAEIFSFPTGDLNLAAALKAPRSIVLTEKMAATIFREKNPIGKVVTFDQLGLFTVTGLLPELPPRSHLAFEFLVSYSSVEVFTEEQKNMVNLADETGHWRGYVYLKLKEEASKSQLESALAQIAQQQSKIVAPSAYFLSPQPLLDIMPSRDYSNETGTATPYIVLYFLIALGIIIITAACFNYMNLSLARSIKRSKEIGIRKVNGATKRHIVFQFLGESILLALIALGVALVLLEWLVPKFYALDPFVEDIFELEKTPLVYLLFFGFSLTVGLLAGAFPAFSISGFQPIQSLKKLSHLDLNAKMSFRKILVVAQFTLSLLFILAVTIVIRQQHHVLNADLGIRTEQMLNVRLNGADYDIFKQQALAIEGITGISGSDIGILTGENQITKVTFQDEQDSLQLYFLNGTANYLENHDIQLLAGSNFPDTKNDQGEQFIILNEKTIERMGYPSPESAIGNQIIIDTLALSILGVAADFHHDQIWWEPIQYFGIRNNISSLKNANLRLSDDNTEAVVSQVHQLMGTLVPNDLVSAYFMEERIYFMTKFFKMGSRIIGFIGGLIILISCMGLLGMVIYNIEGKVKEVGIRKVLGASARNITWQLSRSYLLLLGVAILVAVPIAVLGGNIWLQFFYLRTSIQPLLILSGVALILGISMLTVLSQTWFAAQSNPANSLRNE